MAEKGRPVFVSLLEEYRVAYLGARWVSLVLAGVCISLAVALYLVATSPKPVVVVPGALGGEYVPGEVPEGVVRDFALRAADLAATFTPETVGDNRRELARRLWPELLPEFEAGAAEAEKAVRNNVESHVFFPSSVEVKVLEPRRRWRVVVRGERRVFVGSREVVRGPWRVEVEVGREKGTPGNPLGLWVFGMEQGE